MRKTLITISNIRGQQPEAYTDVVITSAQPISIGVQSNRLETENEVTFKGYDVSDIEVVQDTFYQKYTLQFIVTGEYYLEQIKNAQQIFVKTQGNPDVDAKVIDITREFLGANAYKCEMTYYDKESRQCADNLKSSILKELTGLSTWVLNYSDTGTIVTRINPDSISPDPDQESYSNNFVNTLTRNTQKTAKTFTFYIDESELIDFQTNVYTYDCSIDGIGTQIEPFIPKITKLSGYDIHKIEIDFIYNIDTKFL